MEIIMFPELKSDVFYSGAFWLTVIQPYFLCVGDQAGLPVPNFDHNCTFKLSAYRVFQVWCYTFVVKLDRNWVNSVPISLFVVGFFLLTHPWFCVGPVKI